MKEYKANRAGGLRQCCAFATPRVVVQSTQGVLCYGALEVDRTSVFSSVGSTGGPFGDGAPVGE